MLLTSGLGRQSVQRVIALTHSSNLARESERSGSGEGLAVGVNIDDAQLDRSVVLGGNETVCEVEHIY